MDIYVYVYIYIYIYTIVGLRLRMGILRFTVEGGNFAPPLLTHGSFLIRRHRGHPGVVLPPVISTSANHSEGMHL